MANAIAPATSEVPSPRIDFDNEGYWKAASSQELTCGRCQACNKVFFYPRLFCPYCLSDRAELMTVSGKGKIYTLTIIRKAKIPYALAYVTLAEGPSMLTNIITDNLDGLRIGQPVEVLFVPSDGGQLVPMFKPIL